MEIDAPLPLFLAGDFLLFCWDLVLGWDSTVQGYFGRTQPPRLDFRLKDNGIHEGGIHVVWDSWFNVE